MSRAGPGGAVRQPEEGTGRRIDDLLADAARRLAAAGIEGPRREARLLMEHAAGLGRTALLVDPTRALEPSAAAAYDSLVARRAAREPAAHLLGTREFWSLPFRVTPDVLVPRPDSETLVEAALARLPDRPARVLDLGTGSGCLLLAVLGERPAADGLGIDRGPAALAVAAANARSLGLEGRARLAASDWDTALAPGAVFDLVLANPPYVASAAIAGLEEEVRRFEPRAALDGGPDGLDAYRALAPVLARRLAPDGDAALEIGRGQGDAVAALLVSAGLAVAARRSDLAGIERCLIVRRA